MAREALRAHQVRTTRYSDQRDMIMPSGWILVIDDDPAILDIIVQALAAEGHRIEGFRNGHDALERLRDSVPDLILLDLWMPKMSGWEFREQQMARPELRDVPVVLLSAGGNLQQHARDLDAIATIAKPFDLNHLLDIVTTITGATEQ